MKLKSFILGLIVGGVIVGVIMFFFNKPRTFGGRPPMNRGAFTGNMTGTGNWRNNNENIMSGDNQRSSGSGQETKPEMSGANNTGTNKQ